MGPLKGINASGSPLSHSSIRKLLLLERCRGRVKPLETRPTVSCRPLVMTPRREGEEEVEEVRASCRVQCVLGPLFVPADIRRAYVSV